MGEDAENNSETMKKNHTKIDSYKEFTRVVDRSDRFIVLYYSAAVALLYVFRCEHSKYHSASSDS